jgi:hypothetical protein
MNGARARIAPRGTPGRRGPRTSTFVTPFLQVGLLGLCLVVSRTALADPHPLPFSYPYSTLPRGLTELEQYVDMTPLRTVVNPQDGSTRNRLQGIFVTELEYGITDRLELGLYLQFSNDLSGSTGQQPMQFDGVKQRLRYRFADPGAWPVNLAIYGEVAELSSELELEAKIILERRFGPWQWIVNLTGEHEWYYEGEKELVFVPSGGVSYEVTPACRIGAEYWGRVEHAFDEPGDAPFSALWHHYVGPTFLFQTSRVWLAAAPYVRVDHLGRAGEVGDELGRFWFRTIVGIDL